MKQYKLKNPDKFLGGTPTVGYTSLQERKVLVIMDTNSSIIQWTVGEESQTFRVWHEENGNITTKTVKVNTESVSIKPSRNKRSKHQQGYYQLRHPEKYKGNVENVRYMSSWELNVHKFLDNNPNIIEWASEEVVIPYVKPTDGKIHKYYIDYWVKYKNRNGEIVNELWEVKPKRETLPPKRTKKKKRSTILYEEITYEVNKAKWSAATLFAKKYGLTFKILTEEDIFK